MRGQNLADRDLVLLGGSDTPLVALHVALRGPASATIEGMGAQLPTDAGLVELFASPTGRSTVRLQSGVANEAFRVTVAPSILAELASRHPALEPLATSVAVAVRMRTGARAIAPLRRVLGDVGEIMDSAHYGTLRPLFLEARALAWLAATLVGVFEPRTLRPSRREVDRMYEARDRLLSRLGDPPTLGELAAALGINEFALKRNFKTVFGQPVYAFLLEHRLDHARSLLRDSDRSIKDVAAAVGYAHASHFSTAFRRTFGMSPREYRVAAGGRAGGATT